VFAAPGARAAERGVAAEPGRHAATHITTREDLEREFAAHATWRGRIPMLPPAHALEMVRRARSARIPILGIDAFHLGPTSTQPDLAHSVDYSGASCRSNPWSEAEAFLEDRISSGMYFEVVLGDTETGR
jgi:hypothetical protein